jgi:membrane-bound serine protease (ClpP class)
MTDNLTLAYGLIALGVVLLLAELFLPSGILAVLALAALIAGLALSFSSSASTGIATSLTLVVALLLLFSLARYFLPRSGVGRRLLLHRTPDEDETLAGMPGNQELERLRGRHGQTLSALRPAGVTLFDGQRIDTISEGEMIEPGQWVRCIDVRAGRVIVRAVEKPPDLGDLDPSAFT